MVMMIKGLKVLYVLNAMDLMIIVTVVLIIIAAIGLGYIDNHFKPVLSGFNWFLWLH